MPSSKQTVETSNITTQTEDNKPLSQKESKVTELENEVRFLLMKIGEFEDQLKAQGKIREDELEKMNR